MNYLEKIGAEKFTTYKFVVERETINGAILRCVDIPELTGFAYTSNYERTVVWGSIQKVYENSETKPFILLQVESVIEYPVFNAVA